MNYFILDCYTAWLLKGVLEALHNTIDEHSAKVVARWFGCTTTFCECPYGELGYKFEEEVASTFTESFTDFWYDHTEW